MNENTDVMDISFIIPVFNPGKYLEDAIQSIIYQKNIHTGVPLPSFEIILIDDGSTDSTTLKILEKYKNYTKEKIVLLKNQGRKGAAAARNTGVRYAAGTWIAFLDADDVLFPTSVALRWAVACQFKSAQWIATRFKLLRAATTPTETEVFPTISELSKNLNSISGIPEAQCLHYPLELFSKSCFTGIMTVLIRRQLIFDKGLFNELLPRSEDYHLWMKLSLDQDLYFVEAETAFYRIHSSSLTHGNAPRFLHEDSMIKFLLRENLTSTQKIIIKNRIEIIMQDSCYFYRRDGDFRNSMRCAIKWLIMQPLKIKPWKELLASIIRRR